MKPEILFLTDADSAEDQPLYEADAPGVGLSSVVLPVEFSLDADDGEMAMRFGVPLPGAVPTVVWSGVLEFPSGRALATNSSMRPGVEVEVEPGTYRVDVLGADSPEGGLTISLARRR